MGGLEHIRDRRHSCHRRSEKSLTVSYHIKNEVGVGLIRHVDRHFDTTIAAGITIDSCATYDRPWDSFSPTEEGSTVGQALGCDLSAIEDEGTGGQDIASSGGISTERGALA
jgi:hypothetical protein